MGGGDIKLMAMIGAFLNWYTVLGAIFLGSIIGAIIGIPQRIKGKKSIPFGPALCIGGAVMLFWGEQIMRAVYKF